MRNFLSATIIAIFSSAVYGQGLVQDHGFFKSKVIITETDTTTVKVELYIKNCANSPVLLYRGNPNINNYLGDTIISMDVSSRYITDPLLIPDYPMELIVLRPGQSYLFTKTKRSTYENLIGLDISLDLFIPDIINNKKVNRQIAKGRKRLEIALENFYDYQIQYDGRYAWYQKLSMDK